MHLCTLTAAYTTTYFLSLLGNNKDYGEEEGGDQSESAGALFMYQTKLFPTLDSYMSRRRDKVSQTVHAKIENRIESLMKERYKERVFMNADLYGFTREFRLTDSCIEPQFPTYKKLAFYSALVLIWTDYNLISVLTQIKYLDANKTPFTFYNRFHHFI